MNKYRIIFADGGVVIEPGEDMGAAITSARLARYQAVFQLGAVMQDGMAEVVKAERMEA